MNIVNTQPFLLYPTNKAQNGEYSYHASNPVLNFQWNNQESRAIDRSTLRLYFKLKIYNKDSQNNTNQLPANRFDLDGSAGDQDENEYVCYINPRSGPSAVIENVTISNLKGGMFEQFKQYGRNMSSLMAVTSSYKDLCSLYQNTYATHPRSDCMANVCSSEIPVALRLATGYLGQAAPLMLNQGGLSINIHLASTSAVLHGLNSDKFVYSISDVFMAGKYLVFDKPQKAMNQVMNYSAYYNYLNVIQSSQDHSNINMNLQRVLQIYTNYIPSQWSNNFAYDSYSTPPLLENNGGVYSEVKMEELTINRGAIRYPSNYSINMSKTNKDNSFQALRSRNFLNSIYPYSDLRNTLISPFTEDIGSMKATKAANAGDILRTPQHCDEGLIHRWVWTATGDWARTGDPESSGHVYGTGIKLDQLAVGEGQDYSQSSYNYTIKSDLNTTTNNANVYALASTMVMADGRGGLAVSV